MFNILNPLGIITSHTHTYAVMCACGGRARGVGGMGSYWTRREKWGTYYFYGEVRALGCGIGGLAMKV